MPIRVGIDLVSTDAVRASITTHGDRYLARVYSDGEVSDCARRGRIDADQLAARFAAKEATFKVLRVGDEPMAWTDVEVRREPAGWTQLALHGNAATLAERAGIVDFALSLSHEAGYAAAVVVAEVGTTQ
jgi:holo-[acyl-carrier protein] synthase